MVYGNTLIEFDADLNLAVCIEGEDVIFFCQSAAAYLRRHVSKVVSIQM